MGCFENLNKLLSEFCFLSFLSLLLVLRGVCDSNIRSSADKLNESLDVLLLDIIINKKIKFLNLYFSKFYLHDRTNRYPFFKFRTISAIKF